MTRLRLFVTFFDNQAQGDMVDDRFYAASDCSQLVGHCPGWLMVDTKTGHLALALPWNYDEAGEYGSAPRLTFFHVSCINKELQDAVAKFTADAAEIWQFRPREVETRRLVAACPKG